MADLCDLMTILLANDSQRALVTVIYRHSLWNSSGLSSLPTGQKGELA
jgi:hypothetical protein